MHYTLMYFDTAILAIARPRVKILTRGMSAIANSDFAVLDRKMTEDKKFGKIMINTS